MTEIEAIPERESTVFFEEEDIMSDEVNGLLIVESRRHSILVTH